MQNITCLPYFNMIQALYSAEVRTLRDDQTALQWSTHYMEVMHKAANLPVWALFGSAQDSAIKADVTSVLEALYDILIANAESTCNGYHPWGYLWHFSSCFAQKAKAAKSASRAFLFPGDWGPDFHGTRPEQVSEKEFVTAPHLSQTVRGPAMFMAGRRGAIFAPFGKGGKSELAQYRELMQIAKWTTTPFTGWSADSLPKRFLIDTKTSKGWFFDTEILETESMLALPSLYPHDSEREQEVIIRVTGQNKVTLNFSPHVYEFGTAIQAAEFIYSQGS